MWPLPVRSFGFPDNMAAGFQEGETQEGASPGVKGEVHGVVMI